MSSKIRTKAELKTSSTAEYFAKNLQQVGFSSPTKAVLTTLKEAFDNSIDACEEHGILPSIHIVVERTGKGSTKNTDQVLVRVEDNGPGIPAKELPMVFGEYLASSKFGRGRCTRGQQGIGISAATTWAMQTSAQGVLVKTKTKGQKKAVQCRVEIDLKNNKGIIRDKEELDWNAPHGTIVEFLFDGRVQLNGEAGLQAFLRSNVLVNPHLELHYKLLDEEEVHIERVSDKIPNIPDATSPHPHTMKLGEFLGHAKLFGNISVKEWLLKAFSRVSEQVMQDLVANQAVPKKLFERPVNDLKEDEFKHLFTSIQEAPLMAPSTTSVLAIGEAGLAKSILRLGDIDYFSVVTRRPAICDFKPIQVEVAIARLSSRNGESIPHEEDESVQVIRFANRVPLQFDKASCAIFKAITTVNWKVYGLKQARNSVPSGPYIVAVSVVSPFIKFKNASKETIDASDELVEEIRRALMQAGQRLSRHLRKEHKEALLESKMQHIEQFAPILVDGLVRLTHSDDKRKATAHEGLLKILGRDTQAAEKELMEAEGRLEKHLASKRKTLGAAYDLIMARENDSLEDEALDEDLDLDEEDDDDASPKAKSKGKGKGKGKSKAQKKGQNKKGSIPEDHVIVSDLPAAKGLAKKGKSAPLKVEKAAAQDKPAKGGKAGKAAPVAPIEKAKGKPKAAVKSKDKGKGKGKDKAKKPATGTKAAPATPVKASAATAKSKPAKKSSAKATQAPVKKPAQAVKKEPAKAKAAKKTSKKTKGKK